MRGRREYYTTEGELLSDLCWLSNLPTCGGGLDSKFLLLSGGVRPKNEGNLSRWQKCKHLINTVDMIKPREQLNW